ncbi:MAG: VTT domain-containing protein [Cyanobacteria bacterium J06621_8]
MTDLKGDRSSNRLKNIIKYAAIAIVVILGIWLANRYGIEEIRENVDRLGVWAYLLVGALRLTSVVIPALPGTAYSVLSGALFGLLPGLVVICLADLISCNLSFCLSRRYGRNFITRLVGKNFINKLDNFSQKNLEGNFWLMTGFLMTGLFDFVSYGVGLTKTPWRKFFVALIISIAISNPPIVALGAGLLESGKLLLGFAVLGVFALGIFTGILQRRAKL